MTLNEMTAHIARTLHVNQTDVRNILTLWGNTSLDELKKGEKVTIPHVGSLHGVSRAERLGCNPRTGEPVIIPARMAITLRMSKFAKETFRSS